MLSYSILLQVRFTLPILSPGSRWALTPPFHHYLYPKKAIGCMFSVALSVGFLRLGVTQHPALWSSDFPPVFYSEYQRLSSLLSHIVLLKKYILCFYSEICQEKTDNIGNDGSGPGLIGAIFSRCHRCFSFPENVLFQFPEKFPIDSISEQPYIGILIKSHPPS